MDRKEISKNGQAVAAILAAGIGCATLGIVTILSEMSPAIEQGLSWWNPAGPLTGKTGTAVLIWGLVWASLHWQWKHKDFLNFSSILRWSWVLIFVGVLGTFPPIFNALSRP
ncbi:MAG TPA: hypothetical protein VJR29_11340 [bacterium]|nr:hypothetical protein [bacterium]